MKLFSIILWGDENFKSKFFGVQILFSCKNLDEGIDQRLKEK